MRFAAGRDSTPRASAAAAALLFFLIAGSVPAAVTTSTGGSAGLPLGQPGLGLRYGIATQGQFPANGSGSNAAGGVAMLGEIRLFAFDFMPGGWAACEGQVLATAGYPALFSVVGAAFGGNGTTTFALPDLRGRIAVGKGTFAGSGLTNHPLGQLFGSSTASLSSSHLPSHLHSMAGAQTGATGGGNSFSIWRPSQAITMVLAPSYPAGVLQYLPEIRLFAGNYQPETWVYADGRTLSTSTYSALYSRIGTLYGSNGANEFRLPALPGRAAFGAGQSPGLSVYAQGSAYGAESATLSQPAMRVHSHSTAAGATGSAGGTTSIDRLQPTLAIRYMIAIFGVFPGGSFNASSSPTIGEIRLFAGSTPPDEFMFCEGQILPIAENDALFNVIGTTFGGDGQDTFALPNLSGRVPVGRGTGPGLPMVIIGDTLGFESSAMTVNEMPGHVHNQPAPEIEISGNFMVIADGDVTPTLSDHTKFPPSDTAAAPVARTFTASNGGLGDMTLSASLAGSPAFTLSTPPASVVAPGGTTTFQISFDPTAQGSFSSTATIANEDPNEAPFDFLVGGNGANALASRYPGVTAASTLAVVKNTTDPNRVDLSWGASCGPGATGYAVYEGTLGSFSSHGLLAGLCGGSGTSASSVLPAGGNRYFLVSAVDTLAMEEGSLGRSSAGVEHVRPGGACESASDLTACP